jgi:small subunit ribosomal protein S1
MNSDPHQTSVDAVSAESVSPLSPTTGVSPPGAESLGGTTPATDPPAAADTDSTAAAPKPAAAEPPLRRLVQEGARKPQGGERPSTSQRGEGARSGPGPRSGGPRGGGPRGGSPRSRREAGEAEAADPLLDDALIPEGRRTKIPPPSRRQPLPPDLEQEMESAFAGLSMEALVSDELGAAAVGSGIEIDSRHRGIVVKIHGDNVFFALDGRNEGVASLRQFRDPPELGKEMEVVVSRYHAEDGLYELRVPGAAMDVEDWSDLVEGVVVEARVTGSNVGGLECMVGHIRGFIPASQIEMFRVENYADYYEKKLPCVVTEANERRRNLVLSHRALVEREREEQRRQLLEELQVGDVREGLVTNIRDFGAFVDLGGLEGLIHISQLSWDRIAHPSEVLQAGQKIRVKVERINQDTGKIGLNYRDLLDHPWTDIETRFPLGALVKGVVTRTAKFGAFVKLAPGIEGLIHISELAHHRVLQVSSVVREGDEVEVKILAVDAEAQRISLSLKDAHPLPEAAPEENAPAEQEEPLRKPVVRPSGKPLKGGTAQESGGEQFGLTW